MARFTTADGTVLHAEHAGTGTDSFVMLLLPGFAISAETYRRFGKQVAQIAGCEVYVLDLRGPPLPGAPNVDIVDKEQLCDDIDDVLGQIAARHPGAQILLAAHSSGSSLALRLLSRPKPVPIVGLVMIAPVFCGHLEFDRNRSRLHKIREKMLFNRTFPVSSQDVCKQNAGGFSFSMLRSGLARLVPALGGLTVLRVKPGDDAEEYRYSQRFFDGYHCADLAGTLARIPYPVWTVIGGCDEYSLPEAIVAFLRWNLRPDQMQVVQTLRGVGHFTIFVVAPHLVSGWIRTLRQQAH